MAPDLDEARAHAVLHEQRAKLRAQLPAADRLFEWLSRQGTETVLQLLAFCVAQTVNGVQSDDMPGAFDELAAAAHLDMREWWTPTAAGYFTSLPKAEKARNCRKVNDDELRLLDREQREISSPAPHSLHRLAGGSASTSVTVTEQDAGKSIDVDVGSRGVIELQANRTTGYSWVLAPFESEILAQLGEPAYATVSAGVAGSGGTESWSFAARQRGQVRLRFDYKRP
jgi:predicted secreted protein